ncbi:hypothetical protein SAMN05444678_102273 [Sphingomonas sp. YR710]|uniref:hypothetical protein n=1 Tax=Sphingomonas sp. YR710 TaxID=1882773 RepID=UPI0008847889|nr:hypothetical protein [Sphingomonas sp. YR710]SDC31258.1 hypothetical protein SAMN05444678_102273 [Sphingomonas sp. YR710]
MRVAIGKPGEVVRTYVTAPPAVIVAQLRDGEIPVETRIKGRATISEDGQQVIAAD